MVQATLLPPDLLAEFNRTESVLVRLGEDRKHGVVGV
jgi:hypothetical protein